MENVTLGYTFLVSVSLRSQHEYFIVEYLDVALNFDVCNFGSDWIQQPLASHCLLVSLFPQILPPL